MGTALTRLDAAMDYGFAALAAHAASFAVWPEMAEAWARIATLAATFPAGPLDAFRAEAEEAARRLEFASYLGRPEWRAMRLATYAEMEREALRLCRQTLKPAELRLTCPDATDLAAALPGMPAPGALAEILLDFATRAGAHLCRASALQADISRRLGRPAAPGFALSDMALHARLVADPHPRLQFLPEALMRLTGLTLQIETMPDPLIVASPSTSVDEPRSPRITPGEVP
jgi:hypothetical protein